MRPVIRTMCRWAFGAMVLCCRPAVSAAEPARYVLEPTRAQVRFLARSTLHDFEGQTAVVHGEMTFDARSARLVGPAQVRIPVEPLRTGVEARDHAMQHMFQMEQFPDIVVLIDSAVPLDANRWRLQGRLRIRDIEQPIDLEAQASVTADAVDASGRLPLTTTMFKLKPPSVLGIVRVHKPIIVEFDSHWKRQP